MALDNRIKTVPRALGWVAAMVVVGVGYYVSTVPTIPPAAPSPRGGEAAAPSPHPGAAGGTDVQAALQGEGDPHLLALKAQLAQNPEDVEALLSVGYLYVKQRDYGKARGYYLRASQVAPKNLEARTHLGTVAYFLGDTDEALHHYRQVLALDPDYTVALFEMGAVLRYGKGDLQGAVDTWEHFLRLDPEAEEAARIRELVAETRKLIATGAAGHPDTAPPHPAAPKAPADAPWPDADAS
ncbi:MAG: tetratricopeptide repeat protein [Nitrospirae bacterium]|nr:tetratricopeptide repeat protein [Nitrospirota bacterium]